MKVNNNFKFIQCDSNNILFNKENMMEKVFSSDWRQIRYYTLLIVQSAPFEQEEMGLLEQQISEIIKNAIQHGNHNNVSKKITVYYSFSSVHAHVIVEDEGEGFKDLDKWNDFYKNRQKAFASHDDTKMAEYVSFKSDESSASDGGNALCAAVEFWNGGIVFNDQKNAVALLRKYSEKKD